jgi:hypothetical protein
MKLMLLLLLIVGSLACNKSTSIVQPSLPVNPHPQMRYTDLQNAEVSFRNEKPADVDGDGVTDFFFGVILVGDPVLQRDRLQYYAMSGIKRNLLNDANDQSPMLNRMDSVANTHPGYTWWEVSSILLAEKIITFNGAHWEGFWKNASHKFLPIQLDRNGELFNGWIEVSFNTATEKLVLHRAGLSKEKGKTVKAGL